MSAPVDRALLVMAIAGLTACDFASVRQRCQKEARCAGAAARLVMTSGDGQTGTVSTALSQPLTVQAVDPFDAGVADITVSWTAASGGGGALSATSTKTDDNGLASVTVTLGTAAGVESFHAAAGELTGSPVTFTATAGATAATSVSVVSGDGQSVAVGTALAAPFVVKVNDPFGNGVSNVVITWVVLAGGGSVSASTSATDASGQASIIATVGPIKGANSFSASGSSGATAILHATGLAGPATSIAMVSGDNQSAKGGSMLAQPFVVKVSDASGNGVAGVDVLWPCLNTGNCPSSAVITRTDADGFSSATATVSCSGTFLCAVNTFTAVVPGLSGSPITFTAKVTR